MGRARLMLSHVYVTWPFCPIRRDLRKGAQGLPVIVTCMSHFGCIDQSGETLERVPRDGSEEVGHCKRHE